MKKSLSGFLLISMTTIVFASRGNPKDFDLTKLTWLLLILLAIAIWIGISRRREKVRSGTLEIIAQKLGYQFDSAVNKAEIIPDHRNFNLFLRATWVQGRVLNRMYGHPNHDSMIFEYRFKKGSGKHSRLVYQTVIYFSNLAYLPIFAMRPENVIHKFGSLLGYQDIDIETHPDFSEHYLLKGNDEKAVRLLFTTYLLDFFGSHPGFSVECNGTHMIVHDCKRKEPEQIGLFYEQCKELHELFNK